MSRSEFLGPYCYRLQSYIFQTGMSEIWLASRTCNTHAGDENVIIKIALTSEERYSLANQQAIQNEERWLRELHHPNIIRLQPIDEKPPGSRPIYRARCTTISAQPWFLVMDFLPGGNLRSVLYNGPLHTALALQIIERVADALAYIHSHGCVHCAIKPEDILFRARPDGKLLTNETQPILIDFGTAMALGHKAPLRSGAVRWLPPEVERARHLGKREPVEPSWDVYALGLVLYNAVSGERPYSGVAAQLAWQRLSADHFQRDPTVPHKARQTMAQELNLLIEHATADDPTQRLTAQQMQVRLQELLKLTTVSKPQYQFPRNIIHFCNSLLTKLRSTS